VSIHEEARRGFQRGADAYERGRPGYPPEAVDWLRAQLALAPGRAVLDVGAGTGKLTRELVRTGATVFAVEPVPAMRAVLEEVAPEARAFDGTAEALPVAGHAVDAVVAAQAFHWFDGPAAVAEFHRVLMPHGRLAVIWNSRRRDEPLHRAINAIIDPYRGDAPTHYRGEWRHPVVSSGLFRFAAQFMLSFEQEFDADGLVDRVGSISFVAALPDQEREVVLARIRVLADDSEPPLSLGYLTEAFVYQRAPG
jgi:ubiquinone/menaquinone biosynthesis C-methylase UbiE